MEPEFIWQINAEKYWLTFNINNTIYMFENESSRLKKKNYIS